LIGNNASSGERDRRGEVLFIDARQMGSKISRTQIELSDDEIARIAATFHAWRGQEGAGDHADHPGFCRAAVLADIADADFALSPGRYVGTPIQEEEDGVHEARMIELVMQLADDFVESDQRKEEVKDALRAVGYDL
jgi:type I restriction enzyme M protein